MPLPDLDDHPYSPWPKPSYDDLIRAMGNTTPLPIEPEALKAYIDRQIRAWRVIRADDRFAANAVTVRAFIKMLQSFRLKMFGESLPRDGKADK